MPPEPWEWVPPSSISAPQARSASSTRPPPPPQLSIMCVSPSQLRPLQLNTFFALCTCSLPLLLAVPPACSSCLPACVSAGEPHGGELHLSACSFIHPSIQSGALMGRLLPAGAMPAVPVTTANKIQSSSSRSSGK